ncbi:MAG: uncharacterized protein A8A55_3111, partial [Amphiamblys sp. WSBS2006]
ELSRDAGRSAFVIFQIRVFSCGRNNLDPMRKLVLRDYTANVLHKLSLYNDNVMEEFYLRTDKKEHVAEIIRGKNKNIWLGKVKKLVLRDYTVNVLPKLVLHGDNVLEVLRLDASKKTCLRNNGNKRQQHKTREGEEIGIGGCARDIVQKLYLEYVK